MASFTDEIVQFNPYIQTLPVEDMVRVGMIKQQGYDTNVQKIQSEIDNITGVDVIKDEHKLYLNQRVGQLKTELSKVVGADYSRNQVVNAVGGLTRQIQSDPVLQNAIISTGRVRKGQAALEEARTTGKGYGVENEYLFNKQLQDWMNDKSTDSTFSGSYTPYVDVKKKILDVVKAVDPDSTLTQMPFSTDAAGNIEIDPETGMPRIDYAMVERSMKGKSPEKLINAIQATLDENDLRQIGISGAYHYRNYTPEDMHKVLKNNTVAKGNDLVYKRDILRVEAENSEGEEKAAIEEQMGLIDERISKLNSDYTSATKILALNPEGYKQQLYT